MRIGYARVSTQEQNLDLQRDALRRAGCERIIEEKASAGSVRPGLARLLDMLRPGDSVAVWRLDRLGRSLRHLITLVEDFRERDIGFVSLTEQIDTATPAGRLTFHLFASLAEFERNLVRERTLAGLAAARARGRLGGRPRALDANKCRLAVRLYQERQFTVAEICAMLGVSKPTLYAALHREGVTPKAGTGREGAA